MIRKVVIGALLYLAALGVYLSQSGAPLRVHLVDALTWFTLFFAAALVFWRSSLERRRKILLLGVVVLIGSFVYLYLGSRVVLKPDPFVNLPHFVTTYTLSVAFVAIGVTLWLVAVAILDIVIRQVFRVRQDQAASRDV